MNNIVDLKNNKRTEAQPIDEENCLTEEEVQEHMDPQRRQLLKFLLVGSGTFLLGLLTRFLGFDSKLFSDSKESEKSQIEKDFESWKIIEGKNKIAFVDKKTGKEVLILD